MPGGGRWDERGTYVGGSPHLVNSAGVALAGRHKGRRVAVRKGYTLQQELDARAAAHERRQGDAAYRADVEREQNDYRAAQLADVRAYIRSQGGIAPHKGATGSGRAGIKGSDEYARLPHWAKNQRGLKPDIMAQEVAAQYPGLGIRDDNDLADYLERHEQQRGAVAKRLHGGGPRRRRGPGLYRSRARAAAYATPAGSEQGRYGLDDVGF